MLAELTRSSKIIPYMQLNPAVIFIGSFLLIILSGTGLLMLPEMTKISGSMGFLDALFTSTSATCVTGLIVEDTPNFFTFKGLFLLMILMKLGGLNIIAFGSFLAIVSKFGIGVKQTDVLEDFVNRDSSLSATGMLKKIIIWSTTIEVAGAILIYGFFNPNIPFVDNGEKAFSALFHSVSAFNNAGFSTFTDGLYNGYLRDNYIVLLILSVLIFLGALGFVAIFDMFSSNKLRDRLLHPWKGYGFSTKIALYFSVGLVVIGTVMFMLLEYNNSTLDGQNFGEKLITSLFQSINRTSGFNSVDISAIGPGFIIVMMFLMFVGSSSSSTGGGIKTSTFAIISAAIWSTIRYKKHPELFKRTLKTDLVLKAFSVFAFFVLGNLICILILSVTEAEILAQEGRSMLDLMYEEVSALGTVGLSTGITS